jgi:hypothetical protein
MIFEHNKCQFYSLWFDPIGLEPTIIYRTRGVHANHYTTDGDDTTSRAKYIQDYTDKALSLKVKYILRKRTGEVGFFFFFF